jgi:hypothetical protein
MEQVPVVCLIGRNHKYVYPYECLLNRTSRRFAEPKLLIAFAPDPIHLLPVPVFPLAVDHWVQQDTDHRSSSASSFMRERNVIQSCPCNCEVDCKSPVSQMYEIMSRTSCHDCSCISQSDDINCTCYDKYDLMFKDMDDHISRRLQHHAARNHRSRGEKSDATGGSYNIRDDD